MTLNLGPDQNRPSWGAPARLAEAANGICALTRGVRKLIIRYSGMLGEAFTGGVHTGFAQFRSGKTTMDHSRGGSADAFRTVVRCPTGALQFVRLDGGLLKLPIRADVAVMMVLTSSGSRECAMRTVR